MTFVFKIADSANALVQTAQVGPADILATISAAYSSWGWLKGLSGVKSLLDFRKKALGFQKIENLDSLDVNLQLSPVSGLVFTCDGQFYVTDDNSEESFDGDPRTQLIGLTMCALAHECGGSTAVELFMKCLAPTLFAEGLMRDHIHGQLVENLEKILNEGAARGLQERFISAVESLGIPTSDRKKLRHLIHADDGSEIGLVGGLLLWIASRDRVAYLTRSSLVTRVATCLRNVGYNIGEIRTWDGTGEIPSGDKELVLVLGGNMETDKMRLSDDELPNDEQIHHYRLSTVGALFCTTLETQSNLVPEVLQARFEKVHEYIEKHLHFVWKSGYIKGNRSTNMGQVKACPVWKESEKTPTHSALRLAAFHFPIAAKWLAPCYEKLAGSDDWIIILDQQQRSGIAWKQEFPPALIDFRVITASIMISIASRLAPENFGSMRHAINIALDTPDWLEQMGFALDKGLHPDYDAQSISVGFPLWKAVQIVAVMHAAPGPAGVDQEADVNVRRMIGWRSGIYAVLPSVFFEMAPTERAIGIRCLDKFWANAVVHSQGSIHTQDNTTMYGLSVKPDTSIVNGQDTEANLSLVNTGGECYFGPAATCPPDRALYLSLEKPARLPDHDIGFCGRINGDSVGMVSVLSVMQAIIMSIEASQQCPGHANTVPQMVYNVQTSNWCQHRNQKPCWKGIPTVIRAQDHPLWAIFLAGHSGWGMTGRICFGCFACATEEVGNNTFVVAYK
jgi:hypothetical protein